MQEEPPGEFAPPQFAPVPSTSRGPGRWVLWIVLAFVVLGGGCAAFVGLNSRARETIIGVSKGANHSYYAASDGMAPAIPEGARFMSKSKFGTLRRGDVAVLTPPDAASQSSGSFVIVKRVIGLPGETITFRNGVVFVNGTKLDEPYLAPGTRTECLQAHCEDTIPANSYFVLSDNRDGAPADSRRFGAIDSSTVRGVVIRIVSPPSAAGAVPGSSRWSR